MQFSQNYAVKKSTNKRIKTIQRFYFYKTKKEKGYKYFRKRFLKGFTKNMLVLREEQKTKCKFKYAQSESNCHRSCNEIDNNGGRTKQTKQ